jgi:hypothetical protein
VDALRNWIRAAESIRSTCLNLREFDALIQSQRKRLGPNDLQDELSKNGIRRDAPAMTPLQIEFYGRIGKTLLEIQLAEHLLQICISYFLPPDEARTVEEIEAAAEADRTKTLTQLLNLMRKRIAVNPIFDRQLKQFVEDRNALAHRLLKVEGINLHTDEGLRRGIEFLKGLSAQAAHVRKTIQGLMNAIDDAPKSNNEVEQYNELAKIIFG